MERKGRGGFLLALTIAALLVARGSVDWLAAYRLEDGFFAAALVMMAPGAFLASLPGRIRRRKEPRARTSWRACAVCFVGGVVMMLGAGLAGGADGRMLTGLCQGSVSAWVFAGVSAISALMVGRIMERRRAA